MSLSNALTNAVSGLVATARGTEVVASNLANATTPGYARRELQLGSRPHLSGGGGVHVDGAVRVVRTSVLAQGRLASAETARTNVLAAFHKSVSDAIGIPGGPGALGTLLSRFDSTLVAAAARPESEAGLAQVVGAARDLARGYNRLGTQVQDARTAADRGIKADFDALNSGLERIVDLNRQIIVHTAAGTDANALMDERQRVIDGLSQIIPIKELVRDGGQVALFTAAGGVLLDGVTPARFEFSSQGIMTPGQPGGRLHLNGEEVPADRMALFAGARLGANFQIRDVDGPLAQARLDAAAADLHDRFADAGVDPSLGGGAGLFTDAGARASSPVPAGLAQRLAVNAAVDPASGGEVWRLRDGLGATSPGPVGKSDLLTRMKDALDAPRPPGSAVVGNASRSAAALAGEIATLAGTARLGAERDLSAATAQSSTYETMIRQDGVDSDREMEALLSLERAYASNAKVLQAVDEMIQTILRLS